MPTPGQLLQLCMLPVLVLAAGTHAASWHPCSQGCDSRQMQPALCNRPRQGPCLQVAWQNLVDQVEASVLDDSGSGALCSRLSDCLPCCSIWHAHNAGTAPHGLLARLVV